jgi:hypothetical protein
MLTCECCGKTENDDVTIYENVDDPYVYEMTGEKIKTNLCGDCYNQKVQDV